MYFSIVLALAGDSTITRFLATLLLSLTCFRRRAGPPLGGAGSRGVVGPPVDRGRSGCRTGLIPSLAPSCQAQTLGSELLFPALEGPAAPRTTREAPSVPPDG